MLEGKTAIITGGTRGIGFATVEKFLENGANVAVLGSPKYCYLHETDFSF